MDVSKFDLQGLQILHIKLKELLEGREEHLRQELSKIEERALSEEIKSFQDQILEIENRINELNTGKLRFSVEHIFRNFGFKKKSFQVQFITTSEAFKKYGSYVTGIVLYDEGNIANLIKDLENESWNDGQIRFKEIVNREMSEETKKELETNGFLASEIDSIRWV